MKNKTSSLDIFPTTIIKQCYPVLSNFLLAIINSSFSSSTFPDSLKHGVVTPIIKDKTKDSNELNNYRPVCSCPFLGKLLERSAIDQLNKHIEHQNLHAKNQSAYRKDHSCETAIFKITGDIQHFLSNQHLVALISLDSSAAFDTVDHKILLHRLEHDFHITAKALKWIESFLKNRSFSVKINETESNKKQVKYGIPQGSQLGPLFYIPYTKHIEQIANTHGITVSMYADDTQLYLPFLPDSIHRTEDLLKACLGDIKTFMDNSYLKLNDEKTQFTVFYPTSTPFLSNPLRLRTLRNEDIVSSNELKILGINLTPKISFQSFISKKVQSCSYHLRNLNHIKKHLPVSTRITLVSTMVLSQLDYCNSLLIGATGKDIKPLERILNKAVRFIYFLNRRTHITPYLFKLHFLPIEYRIKFKVCLIGFKIKRKTAPDYLIESVQDYEPTTSINLRPGSCRDDHMFKRFPLFMSNNLLFCKLVTTWNDLPLSLRSIEIISLSSNRSLRPTYLG